MKKKILLAGGVVLVLAACGGVAFAAGNGPALANRIASLIKGPEKMLTVEQKTGCAPSSTSTDCATIQASLPAEQTADPQLSTATSYNEIYQTQQSGKIDDHLTVDNTLKDITFCGDLTLKTRQIIINGVDVGQRIAQLASSDEMGKGANDSSIGEGVCNSMPHNVAYVQGILEERDVTTFQTSDARAPGDNYQVYLGDLAFAINPTTNEIFLISAYDQSTLTDVGTLK